jgi:serine/threonine protein kinase
MLTGEYPFDKDEDVENVNCKMPDPNDKIKAKTNEIDQNACDFVSKLLVKNLQERLISKELIKNDPFFSEIDWIKLEKGQIEPPIKPDLVIIYLELN